MNKQLVALRQQQLTLENEAIWTFETIAARSNALAKRAKKSARYHQARRKSLRAMLRAAGIEPTPPALGYPSSSLITDHDMRQHSQKLLHRIARAEIKVIGSTIGKVRAASVESLHEVSLALIGWGSPAQAFPGLD